MKLSLSVLSQQQEEAKDADLREISSVDEQQDLPVETSLNKNVAQKLSSGIDAFAQEMGISTDKLGL